MVLYTLCTNVPQHVPQHEEKLKLMKMAANIDDRIEPHPFRVEDFESSNPLPSEIQKHGILIS